MKKFSRPIFVIVILTILTLLCSCGTFKKSVNKTKEEEKKVVDTETVTTSTLTETANENITVPADTNKAEKDLEEIIEGDSLEMENDHTKTIIKYNKKSKKIQATTIQKPKVIPVNINRTIVTNSKERKHEVSKKQTDNKQKNIERTGWPWYVKWLFWIIVILIILIIIWWKFFKKTTLA